MNCKTCRFYEPDVDGGRVADKGGCHRYPPTVHPIPTEAGVARVSLVPNVMADGWCGEHLAHALVHGA